MNKKVLILDMDETMIHSTYDGINYRPHLITFLNNVYPYYDIYAFTLGTKPYAEPILTNICKIGGHNYFKKRYYRQDALITEDSYLKNPVKIWNNYEHHTRLKKVQDTIIVDNNPNAFIFQKIHGITIKDFIDDPSDNCLLFLFPILVKFAKSSEKSSEFLYNSQQMLHSIIKHEESYF